MIRSAVFEIVCDGCGAVGDRARWGEYSPASLRAWLLVRGWTFPIIDGRKKDFCRECSRKQAELDTEAGGL